MSKPREVAVDRSPDVAGSPDSTGPATPSTGPDTDRTGAYVPATEPGPELPTVPGYEVLGILGQGGMGVVYRARQTALKRVVALKMIRASDAPTAEALARFQAEAEAAARVQHANIVQIHEVGNRDGLPYFSLEFCAGGNLESRLKGTRLSPGEAAELLEALAQAVQHAHDQGIVHRDLKPANVLLSGDPDAPLPACVPKIADFGLAKTLDSDSGQTRSGAVVGTPNYMAPEQAEGNSLAVGPAADVWALGAILYKCLTGRPPFQGGTVPQTLLLVRDADPVPPRKVRREVPRDLETICLKCLEKDPARRYASAGELAEDLKRFHEYQPILARPVGFAGKSMRWIRRRPAVMLGALLFVVLIAGSAVGYRYWDEARQAAKQKEESDRKAEESDRLAAAATAVSVEYFRDLTNRRGLPEGIGPLTEAEARVTECSFRIHQRGGRVERVEVINDLRGRRLDNPYALLLGLRDYQPRITATRYTYDEQGRLVREEGVDSWDHVHWVQAYAAPNEILLEVRVQGREIPTVRLRCEWSEEGFLLGARCLDEKGHPVAITSGRSRVRFTTNAAGQVETIETLDIAGRPIPSLATVRLSHDGQGRLAEWTAWAGEKATAINGVHRATYHYSLGRVEERSYDATGSPTAGIAPHLVVRTFKPGECTEAAFAADGSPVLMPTYRAHSATTQYTDRGVETESVFRDPQGKPVNVDGHARRTITLNENGIPVGTQIWTATPGGEFLLVARLNSFGKVLEERAYTPDGKPSVKPPHGVFRTTLEYDAQGNIAETNAFDADGRPTPMVGAGTPRVRSRFDLRNREVERLYLDAKGKPTPGSNGWVRATWNYGENGLVRDTAWYVIDPEGKFRVAVRTTPQNFLLEQGYHDSQGRPISGPQGYHRIKHVRDGNGNPTETRFFGVNDEPSDGPGGMPHRIVTLYTPQGLVSETLHFGQDGKPALDTAIGAHRGVFLYNPFGNLSEVRLFGIDGKPIDHKVEGFSRKQIEYSFFGSVVETRLYKWTPQGEYRLLRRLDSSNRTLELCHFDAAGNPVNHTGQGGHRFTFAYHKSGKPIDLAAFDVEERPVVINLHGAHRLVDKYDDDDQLVERSYFGTDGKPCNGKDGAAYITHRYEAGKKVESAFFKQVPGGKLMIWKRQNGAGKPLEDATFESDVPRINPKTGAHRVVARYNDRGDVLENATFGLKGEPVVNEAVGVHRVTAKYDVRGNQLELAAFGVDGKPATVRESGTHRRKFKYDAADRRLEEAHFGTDDKPAVSKAGYHMRTWEYDEKGKLLREKSFDADGKPLEK